MDEKDLIRQFKILREIKPRKDWVVLTKNRILEEPEVIQDVLPAQAGFPSRTVLPFLGWKLVLAPVIGVLIVVGLFGFAQNTVPGDFLFPVKKVVETAQVDFSSQAEKPKAHLKLANERLKEIAEASDVKNLAPAIKEFQANFSQTAKDLAGMNVNVTSSDPVFVKDMATQMQRLEEKEKEVRASGIEVGDTQNSKDTIINYLITDLENRTLTEEDQKLLEEAKKYLEAKDYSQALIKILYINK